ncbi:hypothetical protein [Pseudaestuariivita atlantica]|uniref:Lipoprotein n=1 Tax=Pseudaestuariivita atlantica TaxID=1317121 RepID=A0A0L1JL54_9RHOB|nr:hypothetical protein [Pseudaestuariivita atlantica]KNG92479.1 hypothetical protein ATO11_17905 [Pseudaestuariivita atlantica]
MSRLILCLLILVTAVSCTRRTNYHEFDGVYFRTKARGERADRGDFTVRVNNYTRSEAGAREAGRYQAVQHCIRYFGTSLIDWENGPDDDTLVTDGDTLILKGNCLE